MNCLTDGNLLIASTPTRPINNKVCDWFHHPPEKSQGSTKFQLRFRSKLAILIK